MKFKASVKSCILMIIMIIITAGLVVACPLIIGSGEFVTSAGGNEYVKTWNMVSGEIVFPFQKLKILGELLGKLFGEQFGELFGGEGLGVMATTSLENCAEFINGMTKKQLITPDFITLFAKVSDYVYIAFVGILAVDLFLALLFLICVRNNGVRVFCRIFSIIFGIAMAVIFVYYLVFTLASIFHFFSLDLANETYYLTGKSILMSLFAGGTIWGLICTIFSAIFISKQFKWFGKPYPEIKKQKKAA